MGLGAEKLREPPEFPWEGRLAEGREFPLPERPRLEEGPATRCASKSLPIKLSIADKIRVKVNFMMHV
jgi:hypothetical protein